MEYWSADVKPCRIAGSAGTADCGLQGRPALVRPCSETLLELAGEDARATVNAHQFKSQPLVTWTTISPPFSHY
jgi:hypothetical protein